MIADVPAALERVRAADREVRARLAPTPLVEMGQETTAAGRRLLLKAECLQPTGSFKVRGALNRIARLGPEERAAGVVAYSTGNHAQAVAWAARAAGIAATVVMSPDADAAKLSATRALGAAVVMADPSSDARRAAAEALAAERGAALVPPYDHLDVLAGQATIGCEVLRQTGDDPPAAVYVPVGGGGLLAGVGVALAGSRPRVRVIGVEPELEDDACRSFHSGVLQRLDGPSASIADAIRVQQIGELPWSLIPHCVDDVVTVSQAQIAAACVLAAERAHLVIEPAAGVALAGALRDDGPGDGPVVAVATGGNVGLARLAALA